MRPFWARTLVMLALTGFALTTNCFPPLVTTISAHIAVPISDFGWLFALQFTMFAVAAFASTAIQNLVRLSHRSFVLLGLIALSLLLLAAPAVRTLGGLSLLIAILGISGGLVESHSSIIVSQFDPRRQGQFLNLSQAFFSVGGIVAPYTVALLFRTGLEWQQMLMVLGGLIALVAIGFAVTPLRKTLAQRVSEPPLPDSEALSDAASPGQRPDPPAAGANSLRAPAPRFALIGLSALMFLYTTSELTLTSWLPSLLTLSRSIPNATAAALLGSFWLGEMTTRFAIFYLPTDRSIRLIIYASLALSVVGVALLWVGVSGGLIFPVVILVGLAFGPVWPSIVAVARMAEGSAGLTIRVIGIGGIGAAVGPIVSSRVIHAFGIGAVQPLLMVLVLLELATFLVYSRHERRPAALP